MTPHILPSDTVITMIEDLLDTNPGNDSQLEPPTMPVSWTSTHLDADPVDRVVSQAEGEALLARLSAMTTGGGDTHITVRSSWVGNLRWARNRPTTSGITMDRWVTIHRVINGTRSSTAVSRWDDSSLKTAVQLVEAQLRGASNFVSGPQQYVEPPIWSASTFELTAQARSDAARASVISIADAKLMAAGYVATNVETWGIYNTSGLRAYAAATGAVFGLNVRAPSGNGSGWAGGSSTDWTRLSTTQLTAKATAKCLASVNPRAIEPGRYTVVLEPEAVGAFIFRAVEDMQRVPAENLPIHPYGLEQGRSKIGEKVFDERLTISTDPMDPEGTYIPFDDDGYPCQPVTWVERGVLKELAYDQSYALNKLGTDRPLPNPIACRVTNHGPVTTVEEMIASTERGVLVTRFGLSRMVDSSSMLIHTVTRDGLWLIEKGKIRTPVKNMHVLESPLFVFNQIVQMGAPERTYGRKYTEVRDDIPAMVLNDGLVPLVMPPMKVQDFNFTMLTDAI